MKPSNQNTVKLFLLIKRAFDGKEEEAGTAELFTMIPKSNLHQYLWILIGANPTESLPGEDSSRDMISMSHRVKTTRYFA